MNKVKSTKRPTKRKQGGNGPAIPSFSNGEAFDALTPAEKERVWESYNRKIPLSETQPLAAADRDRHRPARGRKPVGRGAARLNVTIERGLLARADAYAAAHRLSRAALISRGLELALGR